MWRAFFLALGIYVFLLGAQCLAVERFILKSRLPAPKADNAIISTEPKIGPNTRARPPRVCSLDPDERRRGRLRLLVHAPRDGWRRNSACVAERRTAWYNAYSNSLYNSILHAPSQAPPMTTAARNDARLNFRLPGQLSKLLKRLPPN